MATATIEVPQRLAEALERLDDPLEMGPYAFHELVLENVHSAHDALWALSEQPVAELVKDGPAAMRRIARRLVVLAAACEAAEEEK